MRTKKFFARFARPSPSSNIHIGPPPRQNPASAPGRQLGRHTQDSSLCTAQLRVKTENTENSSLPLLFRPFPGLLPAELPRDRYSNKGPPCPEGRGPVPQPHNPVQRGQEVLPHLPQAAPQSCCDGRLRGLAGVCACGHPQQKVLGQDSCPRSCPTCQDYAGQVLAKILLKIWQDLSLLARSWPPAKILLFLARIFPKNFLLGLGEVAPFL